MALPSPSFLLSLILFSSLLSTSATSTTTTINASTPPLLTSSMETLCHSTPYPSSCLSSLKLSISISINLPNPSSLLSLLLHSLSSALSSASSLSPLLRSASLSAPPRHPLHDCQDLHLITLSSLQTSSSLLSSPAGPTPSHLADVRAHLSAALTNKATCLDGGPLQPPTLLSSFLDAYRHVTNALALLPPGPLPAAAAHGAPRGFPAWVRRRDRRLLQSEEWYGPESVVTVAADGSGNFTTVGEAVGFAPNNSDDRTIIIVRKGVYEENVEVAAWKTNIVLLGEGRDVTVIRGNRSVGDGWTTFRSATLAVSGQGFLMRDIGIENTAGPAKGQAAALRINADFSAVYRCSITGYQDTLYVHSFRQFYRECDISGTVDFISGNAAVVLQGCNLMARVPLPGQSNVITAQARDDPNEATGIAIQNCSVVPADDLAASPGAAKSYLGRPWMLYSTTVYMESYFDGFIDPAGWTTWLGDDGLDTLYYGEYMNSGPGAGTDGRVDWAGFHLMGHDEAYNFTVSEFIYGDDWLESTSFPYDEGI